MYWVTWDLKGAMNGDYMFGLDETYVTLSFAYIEF